jgi:hypothetical protein
MPSRSLYTHDLDAEVTRIICEIEEAYVSVGQAQKKLHHCGTSYAMFKMRDAQFQEREKENRKIADNSVDTNSFENILARLGRNEDNASRPNLVTLADNDNNDATIREILLKYIRQPSKQPSKKRKRI